MCQPVGELFFSFGDVIANLSIRRPNAEGGFAVAVRAATGCPAFGRALEDKVGAACFAVAPVIDALVQYAAGAAGLYGGQAGLGKPVADGLALVSLYLLFGKLYGIALHHGFDVRAVSDGLAAFVVFVAHAVLRFFAGFGRHKGGQVRPSVHFGLSFVALPCRADKVIVSVHGYGLVGRFACFLLRLSAFGRNNRIVEQFAECAGEYGIVPAVLFPGCIGIDTAAFGMRRGLGWCFGRLCHALLLLCLLFVCGRHRKSRVAGGCGLGRFACWGNFRLPFWHLQSGGHLCSDGFDALGQMQVVEVGR